ncbi:hypothetical protein [Paenibacillus bovis]|uniref:Uncharacterized protein n=1 Tax=Paenibacillus bovis TaxID=1616788 RepID=A0A172ZIV5_9BACL|nr:hypothetical protein [Paenibacillus bovis]ANF97473.1 hypothetical protein AR543_16640 [Paenibacillus bovis]
MSERLSRLERYGNTKDTSRIERFGSNRDEGLLIGGRIKLPGGRSKRSSRTVRQAAYQSVSPALAADGQLQVEGEEEEEGEKEYAPRSTIYPARKIRLAKFFYGYLIFMFVVLTGMLLWWGFKLSGFMLSWDKFKNLMM